MRPLLSVSASKLATSAVPQYAKPRRSGDTRRTAVAICFSLADRSCDPAPNAVRAFLALAKRDFPYSLDAPRRLG